VIVLDSSAVLSVVLEEADSTRIQEVMEGADLLVTSAVTRVEMANVAIGRIGDGAVDLISTFLTGLDCQIIPVDETQANAAIDAFRRFGKGRHPARLNFGDCFSYALAKVQDAPLLFKGDDFPHTDIRSALTQPPTS